MTNKRRLMKTLPAVMIAVGLLPGAAFCETFNFDNAKPGELPSGWTGGKTGSGNPKWTVERNDSAPSKPNVLKQSSAATYCVAVKNDTSVTDGFAEVKFKPISGKEDQSAGLVWRYRDENNYYVVRVNALEGNVVLYKMENGKRSSLDIVGRKGGYGVKADVPKEAWEHAPRRVFGQPIHCSADWQTALRGRGWYLHWRGQGGRLDESGQRHAFR